MKICVISTTVMTLPPAGYAGLEMLSWQRAKGLAQKGHEVLLVAPLGSKAPDGVELHGTTQGEPEQAAFNGYRDRLEACDAIIDDSWEKWSYIWKMETGSKIPILGVLHAPCNTMYSSPPPVERPSLVAISEDQAGHASELWGVSCRVAHNGIDTNFYKPSGSTRNGRYLFFARMSKIKGPHIALDVARKCGAQLDLVGDDKLTNDPAYAHRLMRQSVNGIQYHGGVTRDRSIEFLSTRKALLHMNRHFREPFGLAPVEAQACGCPVIAWDNGAMRETVVHGETGFLVTKESEVEELIRSNAVSGISPEKCMKNASRFSIEKFVDRYEELVKEAIETGGW